MLTLLNRLIVWNKQSKKGSAMLMVIMTMSVILVVGTSMLFVTLSSYSRSISDTNKQKAYSAALTVSESIRSNVETILPLYSSQITSTATEAAPVPVQFASGAAGTVKKADGTTQTVQNRILDINGVKVYADIYKHPSMSALAYVKVVANYRGQEDSIKFLTKGEVSASYEYLENTFGNAFVMSSNLGMSNNDYAVILKRVEGDISIDVPSGETKTLNAKIVEGITGSIYADGNLIIGSETNVIPVQGNVYVNGNLTLRGIDLGKILPTLYEKDFGDIAYYTREGLYRKAGEGVIGEGMYYPYTKDAPTTWITDPNERSDINYKYDAYSTNKTAQLGDLDASMYAEIVPMQLFTVNSRPIITIIVNGVSTSVEGYYNESGQLRIVNEDERESYNGTAPETGEMMYKSTSKMIDKYNAGKNYPNLVPRYPLGGNIYCSGDLIIDKANSGYVSATDQGQGIESVTGYDYIEDCTYSRRKLGTWGAGPRWIPNRSSIGGDLFIRGRMVYAPDNLGVNSYRLDGTTYYETAIVNNVDLTTKLQEAQSLLKNSNSSYAGIFEKKTYEWYRWNVTKTVKGDEIRYRQKENVNTPETFLTGITTDIANKQSIFDAVFGDDTNGFFAKAKTALGIVNQNMSTRMPSYTEGFSSDAYTQMKFSEETDIYIQNAGADYSDSSKKPGTNATTTLQWTKNDNNGMPIINESGMESYNLVTDSITAALTVKYHDKFNVKSIYADGEIDVYSSNIKDCEIKTNLGKVGATVFGTDLNTFCYDEWSAEWDVLNQAGVTDFETGLKAIFDKLSFNMEGKIDVYDKITKLDTVTGGQWINSYWIHKKTGERRDKYPADIWNYTSHGGYYQGSNTVTTDYTGADKEGLLTDIEWGFLEVGYLGNWGSKLQNSSINSSVYGLKGEGESSWITGSAEEFRINMEAGAKFYNDKYYYYKYDTTIGNKNFKDQIAGFKGYALFSSTNTDYGYKNNVMSEYGTLTDGVWKPNTRYNFNSKTSSIIGSVFKDEAKFTTDYPNFSFYLHKENVGLAYTHQGSKIDSVSDIFNELSSDKFAQVVVVPPKTFTPTIEEGQIAGENQVVIDELVENGTVDEFVCFSKDSYNNNNYIWPITFYSSNDFEKVTASTPVGAKRYNKEVFKFEKSPDSSYISRSNGKWVLVWDKGTPETSDDTVKVTNLKATAGDMKPNVTGNFEGYYVIGSQVTNVEFVEPDCGKEGKYFTLGSGENKTITNVEATSEDEPVLSIVKNGSSHYWAINGITTTVKATMPILDLSDDGFWVLGETVTNVNAADTLDYTPKIIAKDDYWEINGVKSDVAVEYESVTSNVTFIAATDGEYWLNRKPTTQVWEYDRLEKDPNLPEGGEDKNNFFTFLTGVKDDQTMLTYTMNRNTYFNFGKLEKLALGVTGNSMESGSLSDVLATLRLNFEVDTTEGDVILYINAYKLSLLKTTFEVKGSHDFYIVLVGDTDLSATAYKMSINTNGDATDARLGTHFLSDKENGGNLFIVGSGQNELIIGRGGHVNGFVYLPNGTFSNVSNGILGLTPIGSSQSNTASIVAKKINISDSNKNKLIFSAFDTDNMGFGGAHVDIFQQVTEYSTSVTYSTDWTFFGYVSE